MRHRLVPPSTLRQQTPQVAMGLWIISIDSQRLAELLERFVGFAKLLQSGAEIIAHFGSFDRIALCAERSLVALDRIGPVAFAGKSVTKTVLHFGRPGTDRHGFLVLSTGFVHLAVSQNSHAQMAVPIGATAPPVTRL